MIHLQTKILFDLAEVLDSCPAETSPNACSLLRTQVTCIISHLCINQPSA